MNNVTKQKEANKEKENSQSQKSIINNN